MRPHIERQDGERLEKYHTEHGQEGAGEEKAAVLQNEAQAAAGNIPLGWLRLGQRFPNNQAVKERRRGVGDKERQITMGRDHAAKNRCDRRAHVHCPVKKAVGAGPIVRRDEVGNRSRHRRAIQLV
jgi:hypothetical protein